MNREQTTDLLLLLATFRSFNEQLYNLKGVHSGLIKKKFNRLLNVSRQYEREVIKLSGESEHLENIYDNLMDLLIEVKKQINE